MIDKTTYDGLGSTERRIVYNYDQEVIEREIEIGKDLAIQEGKPEQMAEKIAKGRLNKFFKETTLLNQAFIRDNKKTVSQFLKENHKIIKMGD